MSAENKIEKLVEEAMALIGPALAPGIQSDYAQAVLSQVNNKKQLNDFKDDYSGYANYKTYDDLGHMMKRGGVLGAAAAGGGIGLAHLHDAINPEDSIGIDQVSNKDLATVAGAATGSGMLGGAVSRGWRAGFNQPSLHDKVKEVEKNVGK